MLSLEKVDKKIQGVIKVFQKATDGINKVIAELNDQIKANEEEIKEKEIYNEAAKLQVLQYQDTKTNINNIFGINTAEKNYTTLDV